MKNRILCDILFFLLAASGSVAGCQRAVYGADPCPCPGTGKCTCIMCPGCKCDGCNCLVAAKLPLSPKLSSIPSDLKEFADAMRKIAAEIPPAIESSRIAIAQARLESQAWRETAEKGIAAGQAQLQGLIFTTLCGLGVAILIAVFRR